jgi:hypothetical protein
MMRRDRRGVGGLAAWAALGRGATGVGGGQPLRSNGQGEGELDGGGGCKPRTSYKCGAEAGCSADKGRKYDLDDDCTWTVSACEQKYCVSDSVISAPRRVL